MEKGDSEQSLSQLTRRVTVVDISRTEKSNNVKNKLLTVESSLTRGVSVAHDKQIKVGQTNINFKINSLDIADLDKYFEVVSSYIYSASTVIVVMDPDQILQAGGYEKINHSLMQIKKAMNEDAFIVLAVDARKVNLNATIGTLEKTFKFDSHFGREDMEDMGKVFKDVALLTCSGQVLSDIVTPKVNEYLQEKNKELSLDQAEIIAVANSKFGDTKLNDIHDINGQLHYVDGRTRMFGSVAVDYPGMTPKQLNAWHDKLSQDRRQQVGDVSKALASPVGEAGKNAIETICNKIKDSKLGKPSQLKSSLTKALDDYDKAVGREEKITPTKGMGKT